MKKFRFTEELIMQKCSGASISSLMVDFLNQNIIVTFNYLDQNSSLVISKQRMIPLPENPDLEIFAINQLVNSGIIPSGEIEA